MSEKYKKKYTGGKWPIVKVPLCKISLRYRDDIAFRIIYLMTQNESYMQAWSRCPHRPKKQHTYSSKYVKKWFNLIKKDKKIYKPVFGDFDKRKGVYYTSGAVRVAAAYVCGIGKIPVALSVGKNTKSFNINTKHFRGMPNGLVERLCIRRQISWGLPILEYSIPELGFMGKQPININWDVIRNIWNAYPTKDQFLLEYSKLSKLTLEGVNKC